jgi:carbon storage regulator
VLVFTRKLDQAIVIGDGVEVTVLRIGRDSVRLGVTAARHMPVHRGEVYEAIRRANTSAVADSSTVETIVTRLRHDTTPR